MKLADLKPRVVHWKKWEERKPTLHRPTSAGRGYYNWKDMQIGDTFIARSAGCITNAKKQTGFKFSTKQIGAYQVEICRIA